MRTSGVALASSNWVYSITGLLPQNPDTWPSLCSWPRLIRAHTWYKKQGCPTILFSRENRRTEMWSTSVLTLLWWPCLPGQGVPQTQTGQVTSSHRNHKPIKGPAWSGRDLSSDRSHCWGLPKLSLPPPVFSCQRQPTPVLLPGKSHGWRNLVGYSPWDHKESDTTERFHFHFPLSWITILELMRVKA